jgi:uncharacterized protein (TIGR02231 family)
MISLINTEIVAVTVYHDRALVTRRGKIVLTGEERKLKLDRLPIDLESESVRVRGTGEIAVKLLGVNTQIEYSVASAVERVAELIAEIESLEADKLRLQASLDGLELQLNFLGGLQTQTESSFARSLAQQKIGITETIGLLDFIGTQHRKYALDRDCLRHQQQAIDKQLQVTRDRLKQIQNPRPTTSQKLEIAIEPSGAGDFQLEVTYQIRRASWTPRYDLRVDTERKQIQLTYLAEISQSTNEDWQDVALTLSTARSGAGNLPPQLAPWYIDDPTVLSATPKMMMARRRTVEEDEVEMGEMVAAMAAAPAPQISATVATAEVARQGSVVNFGIGGDSNIPSDGNPHQVTILADDLPGEFRYIAMPKLVDFVYLQIHTKNPDRGVRLLAGNANIFRDDTFIGRTAISNLAPGEEFKLDLGVEDGIKIDRELVERQVDRKFLGSNRRIIFAYRLKIANLLDSPISIQIDDQIPHSRSERIKIKLLKVNPQIAIGELGRLSWQLELSPRSKQEINYQFEVEHPSSIQPTDLGI